MDTSLPVSGKQRSAYDLQTHLSDYLSVIYKYKWIVLCCFICIVGGVTAFSLLSTPTYQATAQIMIREQPSPVNPLGENTQRSFVFSEYFQTQVNLLSNRSLLWEVISTGNIRTLIEQHMRKTSDAPESSELRKEDIILKDQDIIKWYTDRLEIVPVQESNLVKVSFSGTDPELITKIVNTHTQNAIDRNVRIQKANAHKALDWLKNQIKNQKQEVEEAQKKIHNYKKENDLLTMEDRQNLISEELDQINADLVEARNLRIAKQAALNQLLQAGIEQEEILALPEIVNDSVLQNLRNRLVELKAGKIEMGTKYGEKHPKMIQYTLGINQLKNEIDIEIRRLKSAIQADLKRAIAIESDLLKTLDEKKEVAMALGERNIDYDVLRRQADSSDELYDFLLRQSEEISLSSVMDSSSIQIVDQAEVPQKPVKPDHMVNIALAIIIGLFFSSGLAFFTEYMDNTVKEPMDITVRLGIPLLGVVPFDKRLRKNETLALPWNKTLQAEKKSTKHKGKYPYPDRFPVLLKTTDNGAPGRVVVIESATMEEGKTTIAIKAASTMAASGMRVLLMDGDLIRPKLSNFLGDTNGNGLANFIKKILDFQLKDGDLSVCSIDDLFFLIGLKRWTGQLVVTNSDAQRMDVFFKNGSLFHLQNPNSQDVKRLGTMLTHSDLITEEQLQDALSRNERTGQPLGYILVNAGYLTREKLQGPLRLQVEENLQQLFSWKTGRFEFFDGEVSIYKRERITFAEQYSDTIKMLGRLEGSRLIESEIMSQVISGYMENLCILPAGTNGEEENTHINQSLMKKVFDLLKERFDAIVIDTSPLEAQAETKALFPLVDDIVFVVKAGKLSHKDLNQAKNTLPQEKLIGAILNQVKIKTSPYYNYY